VTDASTEPSAFALGTSVQRFVSLLEALGERGQHLLDAADESRTQLAAMGSTVVLGPAVLLAAEAELRARDARLWNLFRAAVKGTFFVLVAAKSRNADGRDVVADIRTDLAFVLSALGCQETDVKAWFRRVADGKELPQQLLEELRVMALGGATAAGHKRPSPAATNQPRRAGGARAAEDIRDGVSSRRQLRKGDE
jgi:hypothetical protein